jgi:hypothetical protein
MKQYYTFIMVAATAMLLSGCGGGGSTAPAPGNVTAVAGDSSVTVSWDMQPGVEYWLWAGPGTNISPQNCSSTPGCTTTGPGLGGATSPQVFSNLLNGTTYSFSINGRIGGGKGGPGSAAVTATPRLAGATWNTGTPLANDLRGVVFGSTFVAAGTNGALFSSANGVTWAPLINPDTTVPKRNLYAITYDSFHAKYVAVGAGGLILTSADTITWAQPTSNTTTEDLLAITNNAAGQLVATGTHGSILTSTDATTWIEIKNAAGNANSLYAITYGYGTTTGYLFVAAGAGGTLLTSSDAATWNKITSPTTLDLHGVSYGAGAATFVAVGASGALVTSTTGDSWNLQTAIGSTWLNAVTYGRQFIAVDNVGSIFYSTDGLNWLTATSNTNTQPLYAVTPYAHTYSTVGASGVNMTSK